MYNNNNKQTFSTIKPFTNQEEFLLFFFKK